MQKTERERFLRRLAEWEPERGVLSVYLGIDPADRSGAWRIELRERLRSLAGEVRANAERKAIESAAKRVLERFPENGPPPPGRGHAGFVEVSAQPEEVWRSLQMPPRQIEVVRAPRPHLRPLIELFDEGPYVGIALVSAERVRLLEWSLGALRELDDWEIVLWSRDWRERKAERSLPGAMEGTSASGRDQYGQRLEANRQRFLREVGQRIGGELERHGWRHLIVFGAERHGEDLTAGVSGRRDRVHRAPQELLTAPEAEIAKRVAEEVASLNRDRQRTLVESLEEAVGSDTGAALGPREVLEALTEGRVRHLIFDAERDYDDASIEGSPASSSDGVPVAERMIELAVATSAEITPVEGGPAAEALSRHDGVAALLRY